jgi:four helix bundle protein
MLFAQLPRLWAMQDFKRLVVWHKAHALFLAVHRALGTGSTKGAFGLRAQTLKAAASISANIAEGCGKASTREFLRFLDVSIGSARELENHLIVARDVQVIPPDTFFALNDQVREVQRMLVGLINALKAQPPRT